MLKLKEKVDMLENKQREEEASNAETLEVMKGKMRELESKNVKLAEKVKEPLQTSRHCATIEGSLLLCRIPNTLPEGDF